ncbi:MAG TPA: patatin-like phospholipase family protein [Candidatus Deferrimicrobium sp.]|nr:patatin-like phospholipase family protein [Candidatus Deferrimicrobium sp.]
MPLRRSLHVVLPSLVLLLLSSCARRAVKPIPVDPPRKAVKVALVLGAGAAKGFAHVGVLKVLEANHVPVHMIVGTSVGSFVGSLYAYGYPAYDLQKIAMGLEKGELADWTIPDNGFVKGEKLEAYVNRMIRGTTMENLRVPFYAVATDIGSGQEMVFGKGNTGLAVRASCAIPGVFRPVRIGDRTYVDGGVTSPVAVDAARRMGADVVIAVDITGGVSGFAPETTLDTIFHSINVMYSKIAAAQLSRADVVIQPKVGHIDSGDFTRRHEAILEGETAAQAALPKIQQLLGEHSR